MQGDENLTLDRFEEIETIRNIVHRLANSSLIVKGWTVAIVVIFLLLSKTHYLVFVTVVVVLLFWYVDAYFLRQATAWKAIYTEIVESKPNNSVGFHDMRTARYEAGLEIGSTSKLMVSRKLLIFYGFALLLTIAYTGATFALSHG